MRNRVIYLLITFFAVSNLCAAPKEKASKHQISSPDNKQVFQFYQKDLGDGKTQMYYSIHFDEKQVVLDSELGILIENNLFESALGIENDPSKKWCENLILKSVDRDTVNETWQPVYGERSVVSDNYNEMVLHFSKYAEGEEMEEGHAGTSYDKRRSYQMDIVVRAYNEGIAFRYHFPETSNGLFLHIVGEQTSYTMPKGTMAYYERWAQGPYSYLPLENWPDECERPLTLDLKNGLNVSLLEAQMVDYSRGKFRLSEEKASTIELSMYDKVDVITPYSTPWRVVMVAETPVELLQNNDIVLNLNSPNKLENTSWIKPGKVIRSYLSTGEAKECIDFASERNLQYVHLDAGWYGQEMKVASDATTISPERDIDMYEIVNYASSKDVGIFLYINQRALYGHLDKVFSQCREWGIKGVKFGFVQIGSNHWTTWMHDAVKKAAKYQLMVDIHDEYRPTGFSRTYPNLMTQEGIKGNEEMPDATHSTILPFTRFLAGAADHTICYYSDRIKNTHGHQLALSVICYSPIQYLYWYDKPHMYKGEKEIAFFDAVPTVWDNTKVLNGEIVEYITIARKSGEEWFIGSITNIEERKIEISLNFLDKDKNYQTIMYYDDPGLNSRTQVNMKEMKVDSSEKLSLPLLPSGGVAIHLVPIEENN